MSLDTSSFGTMSIKTVVAKTLKLQDNINFANNVTLESGTLSGNGYTLKFPVADGTSGQVLSWTTGGQLTWASNGSGGVPSSVADFAVTNDFSANHAIVTGELKLADTKRIYLGTSDDAYLVHNGTDTHIINNNTGNLVITNTVTNKFIHMKLGTETSATGFKVLDSASNTLLTVDGAGDSTVNGSMTVDSLKIDGTTIGRTTDTDMLSFVSDSNLAINANLSINGNFIISDLISNSGDFKITNTANDKKILMILGSDTLSSGFEVHNASDTSLFRVGGDGVSTFSGNAILEDNKILKIGTGGDLDISSDGTNTTLTSNNGNLVINNDNATGKTIFSLGTDTSATYFDIRTDTGVSLFRVDGDGNIHIDKDTEVSHSVHIYGAVQIDGDTAFNGNVDMQVDNKKLNIGAGDDLQIYHDGSNSYIDNNTGHLIIHNKGTSSGDSLITKIGTNTNTTTFRVQNSDNTTKLQVDGAGLVTIADDLTFGSDAFKISFAGSNTSLTNNTGNLTIDNTAVDKSTIIMLGSDTSATAFDVQNNSGTSLFKVDGSGATFVNISLDLGDDDQLGLGNDDDLSLLHNGTNSIITSKTGDLYIHNSNSSGKTLMQLGSSTNSSSLVITNSSAGSLFKVDGAGLTTAYGDIKLNSSGNKFKTFGDALTIFTDASTNQIIANTKNLAITQETSDKDIIVSLGSDTTSSTLNVQNDSAQSIFTCNGDRTTQIYGKMTQQTTGAGFNTYEDGIIVNSSTSDNTITAKTYDLDIIQSTDAKFIRMYTGGTTTASAVKILNSSGANICTFYGDKTCNLEGAFTAPSMKIVGVEGGAAELLFQADEGDDNNDKWKIAVGDEGPLKFYRWNGSAYVSLLDMATSGNLSIANGFSLAADNKTFAVGANEDFQIQHDASNTLLTSATGNLIIDNTNTSGKSIFILGTDTTASAFEVQNNSAAAKFVVNGAGSAVFNTNQLSVESGGRTGFGTLDVNSNIGDAQVGILNGSDQVGLWVKSTDNNPVVIVESTHAGSTEPVFEVKAPNQTQSTDKLFLVSGATSAVTIWGDNTTDFSEAITVSGNISLNTDNKTLSVGASSDFGIIHDGTNTIATSITGNLTIDNTNTTGMTQIQLGTDTNATAFKVLNNSGTSLFTVDASGLTTLAGDLTVSGTTTTVNSTIVTIADPLFEMANNNSANIVDIGTYGKYVSSGTKYTGVVWDASETKLRAFYGLEEEPTTTINIAGTGYTVSTLVANIEGSGDSTITGSLIVDNIKIDGTTIGHTSDTDLLTLTSAQLVIAGNCDVTGGIDITADSALTIGTGGDISISHDGTNSKLTSATGNFTIDNTVADKKTIMLLGTDTSATGFEVQNNSAAAKFAVNGAGQVDIAGNLDVTGGIDIDADSVALTIGAGGDISMSHDGTNSKLTSATGNFTIDNTVANKKIIMLLGTDTSATGFEIQNNSASALFVMDGAGDATVTGSMIVDNIKINGTTIGHTGDTDLLTLTSGQLVVAGNLDATNGADITGAALTTAVGITNSAGEVLVSGGNLQLNDSIALSLGTGDDVSMSHDGTNSKITSATGNFTIDNTLATGKTIMMLGTDTTATAFEVQNNSATALMRVDGAGNAIIGGTGTPAKRLELVDASNAQLRLSKDGTDHIQFFAEGGGDARLFIQSSHTDRINLILKTSDTEVMYIGAQDDNNQVNIGSKETGAKMNLKAEQSGSTRTFVTLNPAAQAEMVINEDSADIDFRIESDGNTHALFVEGSTSRVGILNSSPSTTLDVTGTLAVSGQVDFAANVDATAGIDIDADSVALTIGAGGDISISHDGTNSILTSATGNFTIDNTVADKKTIMLLGSDDANTGFEVQNNSAAAKFAVNSAGQVDIAGNLDVTGGIDIDADSVALTIGAGGDISMSHDGTNSKLTSATGNFTIDNTVANKKIIMLLGTDTSATGFEIQNNSASALFVMDGAGDATVTGSMIVDNIKINGTTIGHTGDTDLLTLTSAQLVIAGNCNITHGADITGAVLTTAVGITNSAGEVLVSGGNLQLNDSITLSLGTGDDVSMSHDGTNSKITSGTGNFTIDNTLATGKTIMMLGTDDSNTTFEIQNNSAAAKFAVNGAGQVDMAGNCNCTGGLDIDADSVNLTVGASADITIVHDGTNSKLTSATGNFTIDNTANDKKTIMVLGTDTSATGFEVQNNSASALFAMDGAGDATITGSLTVDNIEINGTTIGHTSDTNLLLLLPNVLLVTGDIHATADIKINADNKTLDIGASQDISIVHDGTNSKLTSTTGNFTIDNTLATGKTQLQLGTDTSATEANVLNNSGTVLHSVDGAGLTTTGGGIVTKTVVDTEATAGNVTYTIANLLGGLILRDCAGAGRSDVSPTAALVVAGITNCAVGSSFRFTTRNTSDAAETLTMTAGTDCTISGTATVAQSNSKDWLVVVTNIGGGSEAYTLYSLGTFVF